MYCTMSAFSGKVDGRLGNKDRGGRDRGRGRVGRGGHGGEDRSPRAGNDLGDRFGEGNIRGRGGPRGGRGGRGGLLVFFISCVYYI